MLNVNEVPQNFKFSTKPQGFLFLPVQNPDKTDFNVITCENLAGDKSSFAAAVVVSPNTIDFSVSLTQHHRLLGKSHPIPLTSQ